MDLEISQIAGLKDTTIYFLQPLKIKLTNALNNKDLLKFGLGQRWNHGGYGFALAKLQDKIKLALIIFLKFGQNGLQGKQRNKQKNKRYCFSTENR